MSQTEDKFVLLKDLGIITVPAWYTHEKCVSMFLKKHGSHFDYVNSHISDENFSNPTRILKVGEKFKVRAWCLSSAIQGKVFPSGFMDFIHSTDMSACWLGVQGVTIVFDQKRELLPKGRCYSSFDLPSKLLLQSDGRQRFPGIDACWNNRFAFNLTPFDRKCFTAGAFLSFSELSGNS